MTHKKAAFVWDRNKVVLTYIAVMVTICVIILIYQLVWG